MSNHKIEYEQHTNLTWRALCACRNHSPLVDTKQEAEDWAVQHLAQVERARAALRPRNPPSLESQMAWYRKQAEDPGNPEKERRLWAMLADELESRVVGGTPPDDTERLF